MCAFLITVLFLFVYWRYRMESLSVFIFPLVFVMTLVATMGRPVAVWSSPAVRSVADGACRAGAAGLSPRCCLTAGVGCPLPDQERELKRKKPRNFYYRLPPLGTLDELISRFMASGFVLITLAVIAGSTWAFIEFGTRLDRRSEDRHFVFHLGHLPGHGVSARHRRMARPKGGHHGHRGARLFGPHLGGARATAELAADR